jgi:acyl dehydratase
MVKTVTAEMVAKFIELTGDNNKIHTDAEYAAGTKFKKCIVHGTLINGLIGAEIAAKYPGCILMFQSFHYLQPVFVGETINIHMEEIKRAGRKVNLVITVSEKIKSTALIHEAP